MQTNPFCATGFSVDNVSINDTPISNLQDKFDSAAYNRNDGAQLWLSMWQESGDEGTPSAGEVQAAFDLLACPNGLSRCLRFDQGSNSLNGISISRTANLGAALSASLSFDYRYLGGDNSVSVSLEVSPDGGNAWITLKRYLLSGSDTGLLNDSFDLSSFLPADTRIRLIGVSGARFSIDNLRIDYSQGIPATTIFTQTTPLLSNFVLPR